MKPPVVIVPYNPRWSEFYEQEKKKVIEILGDKVHAIEHAGSTAVPEQGAKPIIDILVGVGDLDVAQKCIAPLTSIGYEFRPETNPPIPERRYFRKREPQLIHLHMCEYNGGFWRKLILFRDYLCAHPEVAEEYYNFKKRLAEKYASDRIGYTKAKTEFIERVIEKAVRTIEHT